jgi:predicted DNA-binding protein with PD1-like motif
MRWKQIEREPKVFALIFETGDEIASVPKQFSKTQELAGGSFNAIGALSYTKLGWFNWETKTIRSSLRASRTIGTAFAHWRHRA